MGDLIYDYGFDHFGTTKKKEENTNQFHRRQQKIKRLVKERRQLKNFWRKCLEEEKEGINLPLEEIRNCLSSLSRAENMRRRHKAKEKTRSNFFKDPFKFVESFYKDKCKIKWQS